MNHYGNRRYDYGGHRRGDQLYPIVLEEKVEGNPETAGKQEGQHISHLQTEIRNAQLEKYPEEDRRENEPEQCGQHGGSHLHDDLYADKGDTPEQRS